MFQTNVKRFSTFSLCTNDIRLEVLTRLICNIFRCVYKVGTKLSSFLVFYKKEGEGGTVILKQVKFRNFVFNNFRLS